MTDSPAFACPFHAWLVLAAALLALPAPAQAADAPGAAATGAGRAALGLGLESVSADSGASGARVAYEDRRFRHPDETLGRLRRAWSGADTLAAGFAAPLTAFVRRHGLTVASIVPRENAGGAGFAVRYPTDADFTAAPAGPAAASVHRHLDLELQPLFSYEVGRVFQPFLMRLALAPRVRVSPWPGALATLGVELPVRDDFAPDSLHPDVDQVRPSQLTLDQFAWLPHAALLSASGGYFGDNRWGASGGVARPWDGGIWLADAQLDVTGFVSFGPGGIEYSTPRHWSGFAGLRWRAPRYNVGVRLRVERFLYEDNGFDLEVRREMGDVGVAFFAQRTAGVNIGGVRLDLPVPPMTRAGARAVRVQPIDRFPIDYRTTAEITGLPLKGVADREDYLRQLDAPALNAEAARFEAARGIPPAQRDADPLDAVSITGMTGFVNTPWAGVMGDRNFETSFRHVPQRWAYDHRGLDDNDVYAVTLGFLPRIEASLRATVIRGLRSFEDILPESDLTDTDEMASGRLVLIEPRWNRPGLAVGVEDVEGTRRFHSTYAVAGMPFHAGPFTARVAGGAAPRILDAERYVLDGGFGAAEVGLGPAAAQVEYDSEKWNAGLVLRGPWGLRGRVDALGMNALSVGAGFHFVL